MNGNGAETQAFMTMVQDFDVKKYNLVQEIFKPVQEILLKNDTRKRAYPVRPDMEVPLHWVSA